MILAFAHDPADPISRAMAWFSFAEVTHVALVSMDRTEVIEASAFGEPKGVRKKSFAEFMAEHPGAEIRRIKHPAPLTAWDFARTQLGKGYDWGWIIGRLLRLKKMQHQDKWVCSELIAYAAEQAGQPLLEGDTLWHVTPADLYSVSKPI